MKFEIEKPGNCEIKKRFKIRIRINQILHLLHFSAGPRPRLAI